MNWDKRPRIAALAAAGAAVVVAFSGCEPGSDFQGDVEGTASVRVLNASGFPDDVRVTLSGQPHAEELDFGDTSCYVTGPTTHSPDDFPVRFFAGGNQTDAVPLENTRSSFDEVVRRGTRSTFIVGQTADGSLRRYPLRLGGNPNPSRAEVTVASGLLDRDDVYDAYLVDPNADLAGVPRSERLRLSELLPYVRREPSPGRYIVRLCRPDTKDVLASSDVFNVGSSGSVAVVFGRVQGGLGIRSFVINPDEASCEGPGDGTTGGGTGGTTGGTSGGTTGGGGGQTEAAFLNLEEDPNRTVDVLIDNVRLAAFAGVGVRSSRPDVSVAPGGHGFTVNLSRDSSPLDAATLLVEEGDDVGLVLGTNGATPDLIAFKRSAASLADRTKAYITLVNANTDLGGVDLYVTAPGVADISGLAPTHANAAYGQTVDAAVAPGTLRARLTRAGTKEILYDSEGRDVITLDAGERYFGGAFIDNVFSTGTPAVKITHFNHN